MKQIAIAILLLISTGTAEGTIVVTTDSSTWLGVLTGGAYEAIDDFTGADGPFINDPETRTAIGTPNRTYQVSGSGTVGIVANTLTTGNALESIVLSNILYTGSSVGFNVWLDSSGGDVQLSVNGGSATTYTVGGSSGVSTFLGIYDDAGADITSVVLTTSSSGQYLTVDDLKFGTWDSGGGGGASVPEPSAFALLGFGAIAGAFVVRRRRRVTETK